MSPSSFKITLDDPPPSPPPAKLIDPAALTREERSNAGWHVRLIGWIIGLPSILSIAFVGSVGLWHAYATAADTKTWLALSAGIVIVTLFTAGLPIGAALNRENAPEVARAAFGFWIACILLNLAVMAHFARARPEAPAPARASVTAPHLSAADAGRLDLEIAKLWYKLGDFDEEMAGPRRARFDTAENRRQYAALQAELRRLETKRYGAPVVLKEVRGLLEFQSYAAADEPAAKSAPAPGLDLAAVALLMLIGAALGLPISASSLAAIMTAKVRELRSQAAVAQEAGKAPLELPESGAGAVTADEAFNLWLDAQSESFRGLAIWRNRKPPLNRVKA